MMTVRMLAEKLNMLDQSAIVWLSDDPDGRDAVMLRAVNSIHTDAVILIGWEG